MLFSFRPGGTGAPSDLRWEWARKLALGSCIFGDVIDAAWIACRYTPLLSESQEPQLRQAPHRILGDAMDASKITLLWKMMLMSR